MVIAVKTEPVVQPPDCKFEFKDEPRENGNMADSTLPAVIITDPVQHSLRRQVPFLVKSQPHRPDLSTAKQSIVFAAKTFYRAELEL